MGRGGIWSMGGDIERGREGWERGGVGKGRGRKGEGVVDERLRMGMEKGRERGRQRG